MTILGEKRKRHVLTLPKNKFHAKNQKNLSRGFPGKQRETDRQTDRQTERERERERETDPNIRVLRTLSLSRRTTKLRFKEMKGEKILLTVFIVSWKRHQKWYFTTTYAHWPSM